MKNLTIEGLTEASYLETIADLQKGLEQLRSMARSEYQPCCRICEDNGHTAEQCWYFNPLLLSVLGHEASLGIFWRCFHCGAIYTDEASAREHFGKSDDEVVKCLVQLAKLEDPLGVVAQLSAHGCLTGDCPHDNQAECDKSLAEAYKEAFA